MNNKVQHSVILSLIILLTMSGITPALINILPTQLETNQVEEVSPYIVMFGDSPTEQIAKDKLLENFPNSQVISYRETNLLNSFSGPIIYIGHSSNEGISYHGNIIGWDTISEIITSSLSINHFILGCNSDTITRLTAQTGKNVVSFDFEIDALVGVGVISLHLATLFSLATFSIFKFGMQALDRLNLIKSNPDLALPMRLEAPSPPPPPGCGFTLTITNDNAPCTGFTRSEALIHGIILMLFVFAILAPLTAAALGGTVNTVTYNILAAGYASVAFAHLLLVIAGSIIAYDDYKRGDSSALEFAGDILFLLAEFIVVVGYIIATLSLLQQIAIGAIWIGEKALVLVPAVIAILIIAVVATFLYALDNAIKDWNDGL